MPLDDSRLIFNSNWDVEAIIASGTVTVTGEQGENPVIIYDFSDLNLDYIPRALFTWKPAGSTNGWYMQGGTYEPTDGYAGDGYTLQPAITKTTLGTTGLYDQSVDVRYYIFRNGATV
jgi:hypothetical protein